MATAALPSGAVALGVVLWCRAVLLRHYGMPLQQLVEELGEHRSRRFLVRSWRTRVKPGPPSDEYLLRKLLYCERCGACMHGTRGSRPPVRRCICSTRRHGEPCGEPIVKAEPLEAQLVDWLRTFHPDDELRERVLPLLGNRAITCRAAQAHRLALRAHLGARRRDRRRQTRAGFAPYFEAAQKLERHRNTYGAEGGSHGGQSRERHRIEIRS